MQEDVVSKTSTSSSRYIAWLEAQARLTTNVFGRSTIHETRRKFDVGLNKFYLWSKAKAILGPRGMCFVNCHTQ